MATEWDSTNYPLTDKTAFSFVGSNRIDLMSDGTVKARLLSNQNPARVSVKLAPLGESSSESCQTYLAANVMTEFFIAHNGYTYTGYIDSRSIRTKVNNGAVYSWSFNLLGVASAT